MTAADWQLVLGGTVDVVLVHVVREIATWAVVLITLTYSTKSLYQRLTFGGRK